MTSPTSPIPPRHAPLLRHLLALSLAAASLAALPAAGAPLQAQQVERPVAFDTAQRVTAITPALAARLGLAAPAWPVTGDYREARLYSSGDAFVIVVQRRDGGMERYVLDAATAAALRETIAGAMDVAGNPTGEPGSDVISEPAGFAFARNQLVVGAFVYGPTMAALSSDGSMGASMYLLGTGGPFFAALSYSRDNPVTQAQNDLASDAGPRFALMTSAAFYALTGKREKEVYLGTVLAGAIGGTIAGLQVGRGLTDGEAAGMIAGSTYTTAVTAGTMAAAGMFRESCREETYTYTDWSGQQQTGIRQDCDSGVSRGDYATLVGAALVGYPIGKRYVRRASYSITAGDVRTLWVTGLTGVLGMSTFIPDDASEEAVAGLLTPGLVAGILAGDRLIVKPFDYTRGQGIVLGTGAVGGALLGLVLPVGVQADDGRVYVGAATLGAVLGMAATHGLIEPRRGLRRGTTRDALRPVPGSRADARGGVRLQVDPTAIALAAARQPGRHGFLSLTF